MSLDWIEVAGFRSIGPKQRLDLRSVNILIGANGAGKSNTIELFELANHLVNERLQLYVQNHGGADDLLHFGSKNTPAMRLQYWFGDNGYSCAVAPTEDNRVVFISEYVYYWSSRQLYDDPLDVWLGSGHLETKLRDASSPRKQIRDHVLGRMQTWTVYHFHDTSSSAQVRKQSELNDNRFLRSDAGNLAAFLYFLKERHPVEYRAIIEAVRQVAPFFEDFALEPSRLNPERILLEWRHRGSTKYFGPSALSDGTLRFICLSTALLQPFPPSVIVLDEPELGLHPFAASLLAELIRGASARAQVVASTQSVAFVNQFPIEDVVIVDRAEESTVFRRLGEADMKTWREEYGVGDMWEKNLLGGRP